MNLLQCSRPENQISIYTRISAGSRSNNYACVELSRFVGRCIIGVQWCMLGLEEEISQGAVSGYQVCPHPVSLVKSCSQIVIFLEIVRFFYEFCDKFFVLADDRIM